MDAVRARAGSVKVAVVWGGHVGEGAGDSDVLGRGVVGRGRLYVDGWESGEYGEMGAEEGI